VLYLKTSWENELDENFFLEHPYEEIEPMEISQSIWKNEKEVLEEYQVKWDKAVRKNKTAWIYHFNQKFLSILTNLTISDVKHDEHGRTYSMGLTHPDYEDVRFGIVTDGYSYSFSMALELLVYGQPDIPYTVDHHLSSLNFTQQQLMDKLLKLVHTFPIEMYQKLEKK